VIGEQRRVGEDDEAAEAAAENDWLAQPERRSKYRTRKSSASGARVDFTVM
jgi:hypothetical protein